MPEQKVSKPKIEDLITDFAKEEHKQAAFDFVQYLKSNKLTVGDNKIKYKGKRVGGFGITGDSEFHLKILTQYDEYFDGLVSDESEEIKAFVKKSVAYTGCGRCIEGKCACTAISINNPDENYYGFFKKLVALRLDAIFNDRVPKCNYIKISDRGTMKKCAKCKVCSPACRKLKNF